jgi:crotonobetainyl-CoA:carnitine CoA-transferase CaiB-like acyl-CoA transferase
MRPLDGITVVDFTRVLAGPTCTRVLVELGASVTKIEPPAGDVGRNSAPLVEGVSAYYLQLNGGKRNLSIDLNYSEGRRLVFELCSKADVVVENYRPGTMESFGLDYPSVAAVNPGVVFVSISGYGQANPWSGRPAFAPTVQAESGATAASLTHYGADLGRPVTDSASHADLYTGYQGVIAALAGLAQRQRTGRGMHADISMMATMLAVNERLHAEINDLDAQGEPLALSAPESPIFELGDGTLVTIATTPVWTPTFLRYCGMMGRNDLRTDPRFATPDLRRQNLAELLDEVQGWMSSFRSFEELEAQVSAGARLAIGKVRTSAEALDTPWGRAAEPTYEVTVGASTIRLPKAPWRFDGVDSGPLPAASPQGADNREVLLELGESDEAIQALIDTNVLRFGPGVGST